MKTLLNLTKVKKVNLQIESKLVSLSIRAYDCEEQIFEYLNVFAGRGNYDRIKADKEKEVAQKKVEKAYNDIKQALFKGEKYVEVEL